jgi:hypothetical protein
MGALKPLKLEVGVQSGEAHGWGAVERILKQPPQAVISVTEGPRGSAGDSWW